MDPVTEEVMREDFARVVQLNKQIRAGAGPDIGHNVEYGRRLAAGERNTFVRAWALGEHSQRWDLLRGAHTAFELAPEAMVKLHGDIESGRDNHGLDAIDQRSVRQAGELHGRDNPDLRQALIAAGRRRSPIERSR
ncbi:hypothetical protein [Nocardia salmonicida]|uniref:hypothetical protein n=1 Tax=Nocardia salmonicida TaxID=53431 RepID=UPI0037AAEDED